MRLRKLNSIGTKQFESYLEQLNEQPELAPPVNILTDAATSDAVGSYIEVEKQHFATRFEMAQYIDEKIGASSLASVENDEGIWAWLSLFYFDILCPVDKDGRRKTRDMARLIPAVFNFRKYYRHLLAGPYRIYRAHRDNPERALALLCGPLHKPGEIAEQLASRQELITNKSVIETSKRLYMNPKNNTIRKGAAGKSRGSVRRFVEVLEQFDLTWDLYAMSSADLLLMLPKEFEKFKTA